MTARVPCEQCHRPMAPSLDGLGPKCRAKLHPPPLSLPRLPSFKPPRRVRGGAAIDGQQQLPLEPEENPMNADPQGVDLAAVSAARMERRFRKRPIEVTAIQWTGENESELAGWTGRRFAEIDPQDRTEDPEITGHVFDELHKTWVGVKTGQWVIRGVTGEFYPIDESVLAETYEPVADA